ncbi:hypothetical protein [Planococcus sp. ISL-109]|uniref:hypothetical protein n=1 Tax=Planococcus sp. ISL-109 TaxID=2819166 RepID=UPI001BEA46D1|nr:hypothetical protein [Planococcus sp. ISL-109]MBT2583290.1 hypothetical protein [Planococcus sp. ISL-109]
MKQKLLSTLSFLLFLALLIPLAYSSSRFGTSLLEGVTALGFYSPLMLAVIGFAAAAFGMKGVYRMLLMNGHGILFVLYAVLLFVTRFGFQQP